LHRDRIVRRFGFHLTERSVLISGGFGGITRPSARVKRQNTATDNVSAGGGVLGILEGRSQVLTPITLKQVNAAEAASRLG
jgi:hypothetical protein